MKYMEKIQSQALKRLLKIPYTTPTKGLRNEFGIRSIENEIIYRRLMFWHKLANGNSLSSRVYLEQIKLPGPTWAKKTFEIAETLHLDIGNGERINEMPKDEWRRRVKRAVKEKEKTEFEDFRAESKKCSNMKYNNGDVSKYLVEMKYEEARTILLSKLGMLEIKENYPNKHERKLKCDLCGEQDETFTHLLSCSKNSYKTNDINLENAKIDIYKNDIGIDFLSQVAKVIECKISARDSATETCIASRKRIVNSEEEIHHLRQI